MNTLLYVNYTSAIQSKCTNRIFKFDNISDCLLNPRNLLVSTVLLTIVNKMVRVGVVGYGHLGQYLVENILKHPELELAWVWNRSDLKGRVKDEFILKDLAECAIGDPDVIVEVAHPDITKQFGAKFLTIADFMIGSPTALADEDLESGLKAAASNHGLYIPSGALWGGEDIRKMAERGTLKGLTGMNRLREKVTSSICKW